MKIITISREYGAGGHSIGTEVAKRLGIEFYDKDILRETARLSGLDLDIIAKGDEEFTTADSIISSINPIAYDQKTTIYSIEKEVILNLVKDNTPCVILGRCADAILSEAEIDSLNVFIYADEVHRAIRVGQLINSSNASEIQHVMKKTDKARRNYYARYTGKRWEDSHNYSLCLDSGTLGYEKCIKLICEAAAD